MTKKLLVCRLLLLSAVAAGARADILEITLDSPVIAATPGTVITFGGTIGNTSALSTLYLNSALVTLAGSFITDTLPFLFGPASLMAGETSPWFDFFTVELPLLTAPGAYDGTFTILGGFTPDAMDVLASSPMQVTVNISPVPEPQTFGMVICVAGMLWYRQRRRALHVKRSLRI